MGGFGFHEVQFPPAISFGAVGGPGYNTSVISFTNGKEQRNQNWALPLGAWDVAHSVKSRDEYTQLLNFFRGRKGKAFGFRFKDWMDFEVNNGYVATGNGSTSSFQLTKIYYDPNGNETRPIYKPVQGTVRMYVDGSELTNYPDMWLPSHVYTVGTQVQTPPGAVYVCTTAGTSTSGSPNYPTSSSWLVPDGSVFWRFLGPLPMWSPNRAYAVGDQMQVANSSGALYKYQCIGAGKSAASWDTSRTEGTYTETPVGFTGATWKFTGIGFWKSSQTYAVGNQVETVGGATYVCTNGGVSASAGPVGTGTNFVDGSTRWAFIVDVSGGSSGGVWNTSTAYARGATISVGDGIFVCLTAGTSASSGPGPQIKLGASTAPTADGTAYWILAYRSWEVDTEYYVGDVIMQSDGSTYTCIQGSTWNGTTGTHRHSKSTGSGPSGVSSGISDGDYSDAAYLPNNFNPSNLVWSYTPMGWTPGVYYTPGAQVAVGTQLYTCTVTGTSDTTGPTGPSGTGSAITDGGVVWQYLGIPNTADAKWTCDFTTGIVTFHNYSGRTIYPGSSYVPANGAVIRWTGEFDVPARFDVDQMKTSMDEYNSYTWGSILIKEILPF